jgi:hypothetical protein
MLLVVGLYDTRVPVKPTVKCTLCAGTIEVNEICECGEEYTHVHVQCLPEEERAALDRVGYALPYIIRKQVIHE